MNIGELSDKKIVLLICLISAVVLIFAATVHYLNFSFFIQLIFDDAKEFARDGIITSNVMPIGYSSPLGLCLKAGGVYGIPSCQTFAYSGILFAAFWFLKRQSIRGALALGIVAVALHPVLLINIWRINDGNLTVFYMLGFLAAILSFLHSKNMKYVLVASIFMGLLFTVRPNAALLVLAAIPFFKKKEIFIFLAGVAISVAIVTIPVKQTPIFFPQGSFYNFFAGANEYASKHLLLSYNAENSVDEALEARGISLVEYSDFLSFPSETYRRFTFEYIGAHPLEYMKLSAFKFFTILRPGYRAVQGSELVLREWIRRLSKIVLSLPFFVWMFFVWQTRKKFFEKENLFVFLAVALYFLPFLLTNADPRYRFPVDIVFIADIFRRVESGMVGLRFKKILLPFN